MKVSVIIAAYNAEVYLEETLYSVLHQTLDEYEIIIVDDGSTDETSNILRQYETGNDRIKVISKENGGPSSARNLGMEHASGDYYYFMDADDLLEPDSLEALYKRAIKTKADLVIAKYDIFNKYRTFAVSNLDSLVINDKIDKYDKDILWTFSLCNKLFKSSLIRDKNFLFPDINYSEDGVFTMRYVYHASKITGLDKIVFHYRRMNDERTTSITSNVTPRKIREYVTAHEMIYDQIEESFLRDYHYKCSLEEILQNNASLFDYVNEFYRKEAQVLINQFYIRFWKLDEETVAFLDSEIRGLADKMDTGSLLTLKDDHPELPFSTIGISKEEMTGRAVIAYVLFGRMDTAEQFLHTLQSVVNQNYLFIDIVLPEHMRNIVEESGYMQDNIRFLSAQTEARLFEEALNSTCADYIIFGDKDVSYTTNAFRCLFLLTVKSPADFLIEVVYHFHQGDIKAAYPSVLAMESCKQFYEYNETLMMDFLLANKLFRTRFLIEKGFNFENPDDNEFTRLYKKGYVAFYNDAIIMVEKAEKYYSTLLKTGNAVKKCEEIETHIDIQSLNQDELLLCWEESSLKLQALPNDSFFKKLKRKIVSKIAQKPVKNRTVFFTLRDNGKLEGNAKALFPYVDGKKIVLAKKLPHSYIWELISYWYLMTSKMIITDDYIRYLRHFELKPEQRVIQLWHACGAFKEFGRYGTNIPIATDIATHAQYNLVAVSGEQVRSVYADSFDVDIKKVAALGCPRTDLLLDKQYVEGRKEQIYSKHPDLKEKQVILYAPTFRDNIKDRSIFEPEIDFKRLSESLLPNQIFLICPHPVMKNKIIPRDFDNIHVIRDYSTNDMMLVSDLMITDYSSVIFEYALLNKPMAFFVYDLATYNRGFYLNYPDDMPGEMLYDQNMLIDYLQHPERQIIDQRYEAFVEKYMNGCDGHSCERIAGLINQYMME